MKEFTYWDPSLQKLATIDIKKTIKPEETVDNPSHYNTDPSGIECSQITLPDDAKWTGDDLEKCLKHVKEDKVDNPPHYTKPPSGIECIQVTRHMNFNLGNAIKYIWRADLKNDAIEDLKKAAWYIQDEIERREKLHK